MPSFFAPLQRLGVGVIFSQRSDFIIGVLLIARYSPLSLSLLTLEIARRLEGKTARGRGELVGGTKLSPFFVVYIQKIRCEWLTQPKQ